MSINQEVTVNDPNAAIEANKLKLKEQGNLEIHDDQELPAIDKTKNNQDDADLKEDGDYKGRKNKPDLDGPIQDSQETDEVYVDPRDSAGLPPSGKNVGDLNAHDLGRKDAK